MDLARHHSALIIASLVTVASFLAVTAYSQHQLARLDDVSQTLENTSVPSIESLARAGVRLRRIRELLADAVASPRAAPLSTDRAELLALEEDVARYVGLTPLPGERELWIRLRDDLARVMDAADKTLSAVESRDLARAGALLETSAEPAFDRAGRTLLATLDFDVRASEQLAREVREVRASTRNTIIALDAVATAVSLLAVVFAFRASRRHDRLQEEHRALLDARVAELDHFGGRVAHDILSPLGTIAFSLGALGRSGGEGRAEIDRAQRAVQRVRQIVEALLSFARAGARPDAGARCELAGVLVNVAADCAAPAAAAGIQLVFEPAPAVDLACSGGVATSIAENLVRNAIKFMGDRPVKRITVRTRAAGGFALLEVEDTGPGIARALQSRIFEPFDRGGREGPHGVGLGLATVKRLAEAHGGSVRVASEPGAGARFRVELPIAPPVPGGPRETM